MADNQEENGETSEIQTEIKVEPTVQCFVLAEHGNNFQNFENSNAIPSSANVSTMNLWSSKATTCLINQYKKYRSMVGQSTQIRSLREMFEMISLEMQNYGFYFSPQKCENKWRVLERKYKNLIFRERLKKPGRMRHYGYWEHKRAMDEIFNDKRRYVNVENSESLVGSNSNPANSEKSEGQDRRNPSSNLQREDTSNSISSNQSKNLKSEISVQKEPLLALFEKIYAEVKQNLEIAEKNRERRHKEVMALRQSQLEVQKKLLQIEEQKMELKKSQLLAAAQHIHLNM